MPKKVNNFICDKNTISDVPTRDKSTLGFENDVRHNYSKPTSNDPINEFINQIIKTNRMIIQNF